MALCNFAIDSALHPSQGIDYFVVPFLHQLHCECQFRINCPNQQKPIVLELLNGYFLYFLIPQTVVLDCYSSGGLGCAQFPWRVHHDDVEHPHPEIHLVFDELIPTKICNVSANRDCVIADM